MKGDTNREITADVVVIGSGIAGLTAALSAAEVGARTVLLEKGPTYNVRGLHNAALSSRLQKQAGITIDKKQVISTIMEFGAYRSDQKIVKLWADNCDNVMDWLLDMADATNVKVVLDPTTKPWYFPNYPLLHVFMPGFQVTLAEMLQNNARKLGVEFHYNTPALRLLKGDNGKVNGVIAEDNQHNPVQFKVGKAVVLCTGDYGGNSQMYNKYFNYETMRDLKCAYPGGLNTGDGHRMGVEIGAAMDDPPHCAMLFDWTVWSENGLFNLARQPWLYVNMDGERFMNEDLPWGYECNQLLRQPDSKAWSIWDAKYEQEFPIMHSQCCKNMGPPTYLWNPKQLDEALEEGNVLTAGTVEELGHKMDLPISTLQSTINRYNDLAKDKNDLDFGKHPDRLTSIEKPPYYACKIEVRYMVILSGLKINTRLQVLDIYGQVIPGLYAAGNVSGSFFGGNVYPTTTPGLTHSRAWTFGRLAGLNAASEQT